MLFPLKSMAHDSYGIMQAWREGGYSDDLIVAAKCAEHELKILCPSGAVFPQRYLCLLCISSKALPPLQHPPTAHSLPCCDPLLLPHLWRNPPHLHHLTQQVMHALAHLEDLYSSPLAHHPTYVCPALTFACPPPPLSPVPRPPSPPKASSCLGPSPLPLPTSHHNALCPPPIPPRVTYPSTRLARPFQHAMMIQQSNHVAFAPCCFLPSSFAEPILNICCPCASSISMAGVARITHPSDLPPPPGLSGPSLIIHEQYAL